MFRKLFVDHPRAVNETYGEHWYVANRFGVLMLLAGMAAVVHGFIPGLLTSTGSRIVKKLNREMTSRTPGSLSSHAATTPAEWQLDYQI